MSTKTNPFSEELTPENCCFVMIDHQVGLSTFLTSIDPALLKNNILGHAKTAKAFGIPTVLGTSWPQGPNGPTIPELKTLFGEENIIDRPFVNFWNDPKSKEAVVSTGRKKLVMSGLATEVCVAFPAIAAAQEGYDVYAVIDASADWNPLVTEVTMKRLVSAGVVVTTWVAVLAELANNTQINGEHIANLLSEHMGQYSVAMANYLGVAKNAEMMQEHIGTPSLMAHL
ncbi:isochorismatase family protein [uncultured Aquimarina sp.]|uniref:isochorismatase family protein n=1 Tax=uncultured Aquimarina sp. TaxID=575652 RepID=UPI0026306CBF|nr:isochorismatase family protein [uncultured Aquimarina sp.]